MKESKSALIVPLILPNILEVVTRTGNEMHKDKTVGLPLLCFVGIGIMFGGIFLSAVLTNYRGFITVKAGPIEMTLHGLPEPDPNIQ